jgi:EmrB/QacA subfamily drug resistance transporter
MYYLHIKGSVFYLELSTNKRNIVLMVTLVGAFISALSQNLLTSALPSIMNEFEVSATIGQLLTTIYILTLGIVTSTTAYLINKFNTKHLFISAMLLFLVGCIISIFTPSFTILLLSRMLQASGAGVLMPLIQVFALKTFPAEQHGRAMGIVGLVVGFAPTLGPTLSGVFVEYFGWRSIFYLLTAISIVVIIAAVFELIDISEKINGKMDFISAVIYGIGFCSFMLGITNQETFGWIHYYTLTPILVGFICLSIFIRRQLKSTQPLLQLRVFKNRTFTVSTILIIITFIILMSGKIMIPIYVQSIRGYSAIISGIVLLPGSLLVALLNPITGYLLDEYGPRAISIIGMILMAAGTGGFVFLGNQTSLILITLIYCVRMIGNSFLLMPLTAYGLSALEERSISHGTAIVNSVRQMVGALGSSFLVAIMAAASYNINAVDIHGVNVSFGVQTVLIILGLIITLIFVKQKQPEKEQVSTKISESPVTHT